MADILNKLNSANYVTVKVTDNAITNGNNLLAAYSLAKTTLPNGASLSTVNRLAVILPPAKYDLGTQSLILDTQYVDIIGSTSDRSKHYITSNVGVISRGTVQQTANDVKLYNLTIENSNATYSQAYNNTDPAAYFPDSNLAYAYLENVNFLNSNYNVWSMRTSITYSCSFTNCTAGNYSFGAFGGTASGTFKYCTAGNYSFGAFGGTASGTFNNCTGGSGAFGASGTASGTFNNCTGGYDAFGAGGTASGTFNNCTGGYDAFGGGGGTITSTAVLTNCTAENYSFGGYGGTISGTLTNCIGENYSFAGGLYGNGGSITSTAVLTNCKGGSYSFAGSQYGSGGTIIGILKDCFGGIGSFNL